MSQDRSQKLSEARMESIQPEDRMFYVWDTEVRGFGVRVMPSGTKAFVSKVYVAGKQIWQTLGVWSGKNTVAKARAAAEVKRGRKAEGENPKPKRLKPEFWEKVVDQFKEELLDQKKPKTAENYRSVLRTHIRPAFQKKLISEISAEDIREFFKGMAPIPRQANVCMGLLKRIFDRAEANNHIPINSNPVDLLRKSGHKNNPEKERDRPLDDEELLRLGLALENLQPREGESPFFVGIVRVLLLSGARLREVLGLRWDQIDLEDRTIRWADSKTGRTSKPLNDALFEAISAIPRIKGTPWLFPSPTSSSGHVEDIKRPWKVLLRTAGITDLRRHDLRHAHGNTAGELGMNLQTVAALLGHRTTTTTERYSRVGRDPRLSASNKVAGALGRKLKGQK